MINWFNIPDEGLSNGGLFEVKELEVTENGTYETKGEMYNKVSVNVEGGGGSDFSTANVTVQISNATHLFLPAKNEGEPITSVPFAPVSDMEEMTIEVILYKGSAMALWTGIDTLTVSGNIQAIKNGLYMITGDCTIKT